MTTTPTDLDERARSLHAWDARIRLLTDYDAAREELAKTRADTGGAAVVRGLGQVCSQTERELKDARAELEQYQEWAKAWHEQWQATHAELDEAKAEIAHLTRERDEVQLWLAPKTREVFAQQWAEKRAEANPATTAEPAAPKADEVASR